MADSMFSCIGEFVAEDIDMAMAAEQLMQLSGDDDGGAESVNATRSTAGDNKMKRKKRSEKVAMRDQRNEVVILVMEPRRVRKYRSLHNLYMLTKPITNVLP
nr:uncharacterized protein LOC109174740 [Ipomoea batatas]